MNSSPKSGVRPYGLLRTPRTDPYERVSRIRLLPQVVTRQRRREG